VVVGMAGEGAAKGKAAQEKRKRAKTKRGSEVGLFYISPSSP
jgi:hypothetical protein